MTQPTDPRVLFNPPIVKKPQPASTSWWLNLSREQLQAEALKRHPSGDSHIPYRRLD